MIDVLESNLRQRNKVNSSGYLLGIALVSGVFFVVNLFVGKRGPYPGLTIPLLITTVILFVIWFVIYRKMIIKMAMTMDSNGEYYITVPIKNAETIQLNKISAIEPIFARISLGQGPRMKDVYLKIYDESGNNSLTLYTQLGAIYEDPDEFFEINDMDWGGYDTGENIFASKDVQEIYYTLKDCKWVTVKQPNG